VVGVQLTADQQYLLGCSVGDARLLVLDFRTGGTVAVCPLQSSSQVVAASRVTPAGKLALAFRSGTIQIHQLRDADLTDPVVPWLRTAPVRGTGPDCLFRCAWCGTAIALHRRPETPVGLSCPGCRQGLRLVRPLLWHAR
jgi:hypothetical protein